MASLKKRGQTYYAQYYVGSRQVRKCLHTNSLQHAKEKLRQLESALYRDGSDSLATKTPLAVIVEDFLGHQRVVCTSASYKSDVCFLRHVFGPICEDLKPKRVRANIGFGATRIQVKFLEDVTSGDVSRCIRDHVQSRGLAPKTANRFREVLSRLFSWAMDERGVRVPHNVNPVAKVERYRVPAPQIEFLTAEDIDQQLRVVASDLHLGTMVATLIFAGLRRAELLWLRCTDIDFGAGTHGQIRVQAKSVGGEFWQPKTKMNRVIPISATLKRFLVDHGGTDKSNAWLFPCVGPATFGTVLLDG